MTRDEFSASYRLLKSLTDAGIRSYHALETASGDVVMVHLMDRGDSETGFAIRALIEGLPAEDRSAVITQGELDGHPLLVTRVLPGFTTLTGWLASRTGDRSTDVTPVLPRVATPSTGAVPPTALAIAPPTPVAPVPAIPRVPTPGSTPSIAPPAPPVVAPPASAANTAPSLPIVSPMPAAAPPTMPAPPFNTPQSTPPSAERAVAAPRSAPSVPSTPAHPVAAPPLRIDALNAPPTLSATDVVNSPTPMKQAQSAYDAVVGAAPTTTAPIMPPSPPPGLIIPARSSGAGGARKVDPTTGEPKARLVPLLLALLLVTVVTVGVVTLVLAP